MPEQVTTKKNASKAERLLYLEQLSQTLMGLQSANQALLARRAFAGAEESRAIDIHVSENNSAWAKASAAQALYFSEEHVKFSPPTDEEVEKMKELLSDLDGIIAANTKASTIMSAVTKLISAFNDTQA